MDTAYTTQPETETPSITKDGLDALMTYADFLYRVYPELRPTDRGD